MIGKQKLALLLASGALLAAVPAAAYDFNGFRIEAQGGWDQLDMDYSYYGLNNSSLNEKRTVGPMAPKPALMPRLRIA